MHMIDPATGRQFDVMAGFEEALHRHLAEHQTGGKNWPQDATYALMYRLSTWPVGEDKEDTVAFFANAEELQAKVRDLDEWARLEDNSWRLISLHMWDLGPVLVTQDREVHMYGPPAL